MTEPVTAQQVDPTIAERYWRDGFCFPLPGLSTAEAVSIRARMEAHEAECGGPLEDAKRHQAHLLFTWADDLARHPAILDAVEQIIGPDILCWVTNFFIKEPGDGGFVSWHQDATYWGLEPADSILTAWVALSDVPLESGPMRFLAGSHKTGQQAHADTFDADNLLSRGQEIAVEVDESRATDVVLRAGEFSLHHVLLTHGSRPNVSDDRRLGFAIRYIPTSARQTKLRDAAVLVRGEDRYGHFDLLPGPRADLDADAWASHADSSARMKAAVYSGVEDRKP